MKLKKLAGNLFFFLGLILLWQLFYTAACDWLKLIKPYAAPNPSGVVKCLISLTSNGTLLSAVTSSLLRALSGFLIAVLIGMILGALIIRFSYLERNLKPLILGIQTLPSIC